MISGALNFLKEQLNPFLVANYPLSNAPQRVAISNIVQQETGDQGLSQTDLPDDKILITLINVEEETTFKDQHRHQKLPNGNIRFREPELALNLYVLFASHFNNYDAALKHLSGTIRYFQAYNVFDVAQYPSMATFHPNLKRIVMDLRSMPIDQQSNFWQSMGGKFLPSVMYKLRMLVFQEDIEIVTSLPIIELETNINNLQS
jgi:Pvc16 N-terminal domain